MLTCIGYVTEPSPDTKASLKVRPVVNSEYHCGPVPSFNVFRNAKDGKLVVPRYWAEQQFGEASKDIRAEPSRMAESLRFTGKLRESTQQPQALRAALEAGRGILSLPCGYGKTTVSLAIATRLGWRTMVIVHKEFLAQQWIERIEQFCPGARVGRVQRDLKEVEDCDFVIAMLQSLSQKEYSPKDFQSVGTVIVDEAHHICAQVFSQSMFKVCPRHLFGLSATPVRKDGLTKVLEWFAGPTFFAIERPPEKGVEVIPLDFDCPAFRELPPQNRAGKISLTQMITDVVEMPDRNKMIEGVVRKLLETTQRHILVLSDRRLHCQDLHSRFREDQVGLYMGGMKQAELEESSRKRIIVATFSQAHEGLDIPTLDTVILATPKSDIVQSIGRVMREGGNRVGHPMIYDVRDHWGVLWAMYSKRVRVYRRGGFNITGEAAEPQESAPQSTGKCMITL
jgi:superfamily II DNA or RNA helicase